MIINIILVKKGGALMTLDELKIGKDAIVSSVNCADQALRRHILDMGLTPGTEVTLVKVAPMGDPMQLLVRGYELTLRKADAANIGVENVHDMHEHIREKREQKKILHSNIGEEVKYSPKKLGNAIAEGANLRFALVGNQNCGKTTLFNQLTGSNQHVGNFPGVTVDRKDGIIRNHIEATVTDLPGIYSLSPYTSEEIVTREFILKEKPDGIINIIDATNIERNLLLTMQLIELNVPMVIALNMMDEVHQNGGTIDINGLEDTLGIPVVPISAIKNEGITELVEHALNIARNKECPGRMDFCSADGPHKGAVHRCIHAVSHLIEDHAKLNNIPLRFAATKVVEKDKPILDALKIEKDELLSINHIIEQMEERTNMDSEAALADMRFTFIENLCNQWVIKPQESKEHKRSTKIDSILTGKWTAIPAFIGIMAFIFFMTFGPIGTFFSDLMEEGITYLTELVDNGLSMWEVNPVIHSLVIDGVFAGVGSVLSFLPVIMILFFFLSILEDTGYMARVAFVMDKPLRRLGLSGRSFVPMLIGFGCSVPAIMSTRTLPSERDRKMTIFLTPFMSCSAKLPIYALFTAAFFSKYAALVMIGLYLIGILVGIVFALILKRTVFEGEPVPFVMELPNYRLPSAKNVWKLIYDKGKDFVTRAFSVIFIASIIIWFLQTFDYRINVVTDSKDSLLALLGNLIAPVFKPLGLGTWTVATALITGFTAKESVVSTLTVLIGGQVAALSSMFTPLSAFVFLVFSLLYTPCIAAIAAVKKELGKKYAFLVVVIQCVIAWIVAFLVNIVGGMIL